MNRDVTRALTLPKLDQVGFVVRDLEKSLVLYEPLFGPFSRMETPIEGASFRGKVEDCRLALAFGRSGDTEIELIQWLSGTCPHQEFIESGKEGMHHLRFRVAPVESKLEQAKAMGYTTIWYKRMSEKIAFAYIERPDDPLILEFLEMP